MKIIKLSSVEFKLDIWEELRVKDLRKIQPIIAKHKQGEEIEMVIDLVNALSSEDVTEKIDNLNIEDFTLLSEEVTKLLDTQKKTKKL